MGSTVTADAQRTDSVFISFSWAFAETSRLNDNEHVVACATSLAHENEHATDALILCLIRMLRLAQRYHTMFADSESFQAGVVQFNIQLDHLEETMSSIKASLPLILRHSGRWRLFEVNDR